MASLNEEYDRWHRERIREAPAAPDALEDWHRSVISLLPAAPATDILEIGCGQGAFARWLALRYPESRIKAVDFSTAAIEKAREESRDGYPNLRFEVADARSLPFPDVSFDLIVSCECLEHVPRPEGMAAEMSRVLRPEGRFILTTENYLNAMILMWVKAWVTGKPLSSGSGIQPHENFFLFWRVRKLLEQNGLEVRRTESSYYQWLMLPRVSPGTLATREIHRPWLRRRVKWIGRHYTFSGTRKK